jgi:hypothetical protein
VLNGSFTGCLIKNISARHPVHIRSGGAYNPYKYIQEKRQRRRRSSKKSRDSFSEDALHSIAEISN